MYTLRYVQKLPLSLEECWKFFSSPKNLQSITPEHLRFEMINNQENAPMYAGQIIH